MDLANQLNPLLGFTRKLEEHISDRKEKLEKENPDHPGTLSIALLRDSVLYPRMLTRTPGIVERGVHWQLGHRMAGLALPLTCCGALA